MFSVFFWEVTLGSVFDKLLQGLVGQGFVTIYRLGLRTFNGWKGQKPTIWGKISKGWSSRAEFCEFFCCSWPGRFTIHQLLMFCFGCGLLSASAEVHCFLSSPCWAFHLPSFRRVFKDRNHCWRGPPRNPVPPKGLAFGQRRRVKKTTGFDVGDLPPKTCPKSWSV